MGTFFSPSGQQNLQRWAQSFQASKRKIYCLSSLRYWHIWSHLPPPLEAPRWYSFVFVGLHRVQGNCCVFSCLGKDEGSNGIMNRLYLLLFLCFLFVLPLFMSPVYLQSLLLSFSLWVLCTTPSSRTIRQWLCTTVFISSSPSCLSVPVHESFSTRAFSLLGSLSVCHQSSVCPPDNSVFPPGLHAPSSKIHPLQLPDYSQQATFNHFQLQCVRLTSWGLEIFNQHNKWRWLKCVCMWCALQEVFPDGIRKLEILTDLWAAVNTGVLLVQQLILT